MTSSEKLFRNYRLTTAEILYHLPDHPHLIQSFLWQDYDLAPMFPELKRFLDFWESHIDGTLHSVRVATLDVVRAPGLVYAASSFTIH